jgi:hypothetical protein
MCPHSVGWTALSVAEEIPKPFLLALQSRNPRLSLHGLQALQKLCSHKVYPQRLVRPLVDALMMMKDLGEEGIHLKVLQIILTLVTSSSYILEEDSTASIIGLCFGMINSKNSLVQSTAQAALRQINTLVFEQSGKESAVSSIAYAYFQDLVSGIQGNKCKWIPADGIPRDLGLELVESILRTHAHDILLYQSSFLSLIQNHVAKMLRDLFASSSVSEFSTLVRLLRCSAAMLENFTDKMVRTYHIYSLFPSRSLACGAYGSSFSLDIARHNGEILQNSGANVGSKCLSLAESACS